MCTLIEMATKSPAENKELFRVSILLLRQAAVKH